MAKDIFDRAMSLPGLRKLYKPYKKHKQQLLYVLFGGVTTLVSVGTFYLCGRVLRIHELLANLFSWLAAVSVAYATNRTWVFQSHKRDFDAWRELFAFFGARLFTLAVEEMILLVFVTGLAWNATGVKIAAQVLVLVGNYIISKWFVFKK